MYAGGVNFTSLLFMNIYRIYLYYLFFLRPFVDELTKRGRSILRVCICMFISLCKKGEKTWYAWLFPCLCIYVCICFMHFIEYLYVYCYAWVKGELLWSLTLIHTYITPWVLSSSKRGRLLAQRPSTLVLMMINSCSYVY